MKLAFQLLALLGLAACAGLEPQAPAPGRSAVTILIVRHAEANQALPNLPLSAVGEQRAKVLARTVRGVRFTHLYASHTIRARQMLDEIAADQGLKVVQLPEPGGRFEGEVVTDQTSRRAPIEPISEALLKLPPGSVALAALNSENIYAILNRLGVPVVKDCARGAMCVPCADNSCYPRDQFNHLWVVVTQPGRATPLSYTELRYGEGWAPAR